MKRRKIKATAFMLSLGLLMTLGLSRMTAIWSTVLAQQVQLTEKQKKHSKLYEDYKGGQKLNELATTGTGVLVVRKSVFPPRAFGVADASPNITYPHPFLRGIACNADAVVVGSLMKGVSQQTADGDFIFTDYDLAVEEIVKDNAKAPIQTHSNITVSRPGGTIQLDGRNVQAIDEFFQPFEIGKRYLLFLRFIPETGAYKAYRSGSYLLSNNKVTKLTKERLWSNLSSENNVDAFLIEARASIAGPCSNSKLY